MPVESVYIRKHVYAWLQKEASKLGVDLSVLINSILEEWMKSEREIVVRWSRRGRRDVSPARA